MTVADGSSSRCFSYERAARGRRSRHEPGQWTDFDAAGDLRAAVVVADQRIGQRTGGDRRGSRDQIAAAMDLHAGVPAERADERYAAVLRRIANRKLIEPAESAFAEKLVGAGRKGIRPE